MDWERKQIKKNAWGTVLRRGAKAWIALVAVCFIFAFFGISEGSQASFVDAIDQKLGADGSVMSSNVEILKEYILTSSAVEKLPFLDSDVMVSFIDGASQSVSWVIYLLGANAAYFHRNEGEVIAILLLAALVSAFLQFFVQSAAIIGKYRYVMECRFSGDVPVNRIFAPFHKKNIGNLVWVMFRYKLVLALWWMTIIGGFYKTYQYRFVPYILAENPQMKWRDAKKLSAAMTRGYKWKMFCAECSCFHIGLLKCIPIAGICIAVPFESALYSEMYFVLRAGCLERADVFVERAFDAPPCTGRKEAGEPPEYLLSDLAVSVPRKKGCNYSLSDFIFFFFVFCFIGWLWEVGLYIVRDHMLVNRGTMYGPWLPIYGAGGVLIIFFLERFKESKLKLLILTVVLCGILEFISSWILDFFFNSSYWDYKDMFMNLNGRICLAGLTAFAIGGQAAVYVVAPTMSRLLQKLDNKRRMALCAVLCAAFAADFICCMIFGFNSGAGVGSSY